jgi:hypothetical protein
MRGHGESDTPGHGYRVYRLAKDLHEVLEGLAYEDGWNNWRDFFYMRVLPDKPGDISLASHVRKMVTVFLFVSRQMIWDHSPQKLKETFAV